MKKNYLFSILSVVTLAFSGAARAQMVGTDIFFPGQYLEIGQNNIGAFGTSTSPSAYHPYLGAFSTGTNLAEVYDVGHDGWTVGTPPYMGDYTYPGSPFEGWEIQVNGVNNQAFTNYLGSTSPITGAGTLTGNNISYTYAGGQLIGNWAGTASGGNLSISMQTVIDTNASDAVITVTLKNTSATAIPGVYYLRSCDPDNDETYSDNFATYNTILHQNEDATHSVQVDAEGETYNNHWSLCTKDCRAVAFIYSSWPITSAEDLSNLWSMSPLYAGATQYSLGGSLDGDYAIGLVFNVGTINAGDSAVVSYAYVFNDSFSTIDSAFPDPTLIVDGAPVANAPLPAVTVDSFNSCIDPALTSVPVSIINGNTGTWSWTNWTWAPATGLATTSGVTNSVNLSAISSYITYTITGTDSATSGYTCNHKTFYLTIHACNNIYANSPCAGDTLQLTSRGDSSGATYLWTGPGGFTSTLQNPFIFPSSTANTGAYYLTKSVDTTSFSDSLYAVVRYVPVVTATSNGPLCSNTVDTLQLSATPDSTGETFSWTGPNGFASAAPNPVINGFTAIDTGIYEVVTSASGCKDSTYIDVSMIPFIAASFTDDIHLGCNGDSVFLTNTATPPGFTTLWNFGDGSGSSDLNPVHVYADGATGIGTYTVTMIYEAYTSACADTASQVVNFYHPLVASFTSDLATVCLGTPISFTNTSIGNGATYVWNFGDGTTDVSANPVHTFGAGGVYNVMLTVRDTIPCYATANENLDIISINMHTGVHDTSVCLSDSMYMHAYTTVLGVIDSVGYSWTPANNIGEPNDSITAFFGLGNYAYSVTATTFPLGCSASDTEDVHSYGPVTFTGVTASQTIAYGSSVSLNASGATFYTWTPDNGTLDNTNISNPVATPVDSVTTYTVYGMSPYGCLDSASVTITLTYSTPEFVPSAFTPNHDGLNDVLKVGNLNLSQLVDFRVFNRWGQQIFQTSNAQVGWDGTFNGTPQDIGTYNYLIIISHSDGAQQTITGSVMLIR
jgi:gliding motility-associated-like protein